MAGAELVAADASDSGLAEGDRAAGLAALLLAGACALLAATVFLGPLRALPLTVLAGALIVAAVLARPPTLAWSHVLVALLLVVLFIPIRRYKLPGDAGFALEPYRVLVALILAGWSLALLADPRVRLRRGGLEVPFALILLAVVGSILANPERASELQPVILKAVTFFVSFVLVFYLVVSVVRSRAVVDTLVKTLVASGTVIALLAIVEARTGFSPFTQLHSFFPILRPDPSFAEGIERGSAVRALGPAEHPIALGAALVMIVPLALYLGRTSNPRWYAALVLLVIGVLSTVSRTGVLMLLVMVLVFLWLRPRETFRLWPVLVPLLVVTQLAAPGTLGSIFEAFTPENGLIAEQEGMAGSCDSSGRVADLGPTLEEAGKKPLLGYGYGSRITTGPTSNACILDNQWLGTLLEVGALGVLAWLLLYRTVLRRFGRRAKRDASATGWLLAAVTASVMAHAVGNFTFDALGFSQVTLLLFLILGLGAAAAANAPLLPPAATGEGVTAPRALRS